MSDEPTSEGPAQTVKREPSEEEIGPFFPSGMNTVEAAMAGADAGLSDDQKAKIEELKAVNEAGGTVDGSSTAPAEE